MPSPTQSRGDAWEVLAERTLSARGYSIVDRNVHSGGGEIDRVAWDGDILCFIEVRGWKSGRLGTPAVTVGRGKQRKLVRAAQAYLQTRYPTSPWPMVRFDVVAVVEGEDGDPQVDLIPNAFDAGA